MVFNRNTPQVVQDEIKSYFGAQVISQHEKYLRLHLLSLVGKLKCNTFRELKEWLDNKLLGWKENFLSNAGKEILIKEVAQDVLAYTMSCFKLLDFLVMSWQGGFKDFGKDKKVIQIKWLSWVGTKCLLQRRKELWVFMTWKHLISLS